MKSKELVVSMALMALVACDRADRRDIVGERNSSAYRDAMADYSAGRVDAAIKGLKKVVSADPANGSARFQLACILQETEEDYLGAYCGFLEYLSQHPKSDKAKIASERLAMCEKVIANYLADKHGLNQVGKLSEELAAVRRDLAAERKRTARQETDLEALRRRVAALDAERERLLAIVKSGDSEEPPEKTMSASVTKEAKDLLEETDEEERESVQREAKPDAAVIADLRKEEAEETEKGTSLLPERTAEDLAKREAREERERKIREAKALAADQAKHPEFYVVREGDTLFKLALRFYHRTSAWTKIRDANRAVISADNRLKVGDKLRLP